LEAFRDKIKSRGARGIIGLQRLFKVKDILIYIRNYLYAL
jgi:Ca2+-binding EF-hand superfamily protein